MKIRVQDIERMEKALDEGKTVEIVPEGKRPAITYFGDREDHTFPSPVELINEREGQVFIDVTRPDAESIPVCLAQVKLVGGHHGSYWLTGLKGERRHGATTE